MLTKRITEGWGKIEPYVRYSGRSVKREKGGSHVSFQIGRVLVLFIVATSISFSSPLIQAAEPTKDRLVPPIKCCLTSPGWRLDINEANALIVKNWEKLGFTLDIKYATDWVTFTKMIGDPWPFSAMSSAFNERPERLEPDRGLTEFAAEQLIRGGRNYYGYDNPEFMKVLNASREEMDIEKRKQLVWKAQEYIIRDIPSIALYHRMSLQPANQKKWDNLVAGPGLGLFNIFNFTSVTPKTQDRTIVIGTVDVFRSLNPMHTPSSNGIMFIKFLYDNLTAVGPGSDVIPWAAKAWKIKDPKTIDVNLREGMTFHDGKPVTAEDVKFSFDYCKKYMVPEYKSLVDPIQTIEVLDTLNLRFNLKYPYAPLFMTTFSTIPIMPKHIWENVVEKEKLTHPDQWANPNPIGSGPFKFSYARLGEEFGLVKNPNHFRVPKADGLIVTFPANEEAMFLMLKKGSIDFIDSKGLNPVRAKEAKQLDHIKIIEMGGIEVIWMGFNLREGHPTRDYNVRNALAHTIPYGNIVKDVLQGQADAGAGFVAPANKFWHNPNLPLKKFDMERAKRILQDAGFEWDSQGKIYWPRDYKMTVYPK
jgi:peptide/nickel transport system substrate-binding protein